MAETSRGPGRRVGAPAILDAAVSRALEADFADLYGFLTFAEVAKRADVRPATVQHHFGRRRNGGKPNERLAQAVLKRVIDPDEGRATDKLDEAEASSAAVPVEPEAALAALRQISAATLRTYLDNHAMIRTTMAAASTAKVDAATASILRDWYGQFLDQVVPVYDKLVESFGREFDREAGYDARTFGVLITSLTDGLLMRAQFDPDAVDPDRYADAVLQLFEAVTVELDQAVTERSEERLLRSTSRPLDLPPGSTLDASKRAAIVDAAVAIYELRRDPADLTVTAVAKRAGVSRTTVVAHFGDARGLATAVWATFVPELEACVEADKAKGRDPIDAIERFLHRLVERLHEHPELSALMLESVLASTARRVNADFSDPTNPRTMVPLPRLLAPLIAAHRGEPELATDPETLTTAATVINVTVLRALARTDQTPSHIIDRTMELLFDGVLRRPEG